MSTGENLRPVTSRFPDNPHCERTRRRVVRTYDLAPGYRVVVTSAEDGHAKPISALQQRILDLIGEWVQRQGYPPTIREIGKAVGLGSSSSVAHHLGVLERRGLLRRESGAPRAVSVRGARRAPDDGATVRVPLVGTIAAGRPIMAEQHIDDELMLPVALVGQGTLFALTVQGDSMIDAAICGGDVVVVRQQSVAETGDIVAAMLDGEATVKVYRDQHGRVELVPRNDRYAVIPGERATILGKVVCVLRKI
jgi:repressor LexA